tara:strand:- start:1932 stop:2216 length:285 start_codon:yes stop_codon:yes gene_type:complete
MKITDIRRTIDNLNWARQDATGGTPVENLRTNLPEQLAPHIAKVAALEIPTRFENDIHRRQTALDHAAIVIDRWNRNHDVAMRDACINNEQPIG